MLSWVFIKLISMHTSSLTVEEVGEQILILNLLSSNMTRVSSSSTADNEMVRVENVTQIWG